MDRERFLLILLFGFCLGIGGIILFRAVRRGDTQHARRVAFRVAAMCAGASVLPFDWFVAEHLNTPVLVATLAAIVALVVTLQHLGSR